jgi:hypothetical protein
MAAEKIIEKSDMAKLVDALGEAIRSNRPQGPLEQAGFTAEQIAQLTELPKPKRWREIACKSEESGATFYACVIESKAHPNGRITALKDYAHPIGVQSYQRDGGLVPDGMQILRGGAAPPHDEKTLPKHDYNPYYLQWRWQEFWKRDLQKHVGREIKASMCAQATAGSSGLQTPWQEGSARKVEASE